MNLGASEPCYGCLSRFRHSHHRISHKKKFVGRVLKILLLWCFISLVGGPFAPARATSYYVPDWLKQEPIEVTAAGIPNGAKVYLFHSGLSGVEDDIAGGAVLTVYRENSAGCPLGLKVVGMIGFSPLPVTTTSKGRFSAVPSGSAMPSEKGIWPEGRMAGI